MFLLKPLPQEEVSFPFACPIQEYGFQIVVPRFRLGNIRKARNTRQPDQTLIALAEV
ncbi:MAG: hypothetical protein HXY43_06510 [Fischerella sp.]|uniref:hypothetical protein n=1 Tax=unclassified Fischerella TaxID=494603 RepID=UPI0004B857D6|nr:hypothetical protein [Fischerella sp.]NWF58955.1 hypothetical protein [Fischerella sp.]